MTNRNRYLEVTYRAGKALAAYLSLDRRPEDRSARSERRCVNYIVDYASDGRAIGIEIASPSVFTLEGINAVLADLNQPRMTVDESKPLLG